MEQPDDVIWLLEGQRAEQHGVDNGENRGVGADAKGKDTNDREREGRRAGQYPQGVAEVSQKCAHE